MPREPVAGRVLMPLARPDRPSALKLGAASYRRAMVGPRRIVRERPRRLFRANASSHPTRPHRSCCTATTTPHVPAPILRPPDPQGLSI
jgi:hypothetical protein